MISLSTFWSYLLSGCIGATVVTVIHSGDFDKSQFTDLTENCMVHDGYVLFYCSKTYLH